MYMYINVCGKTNTFASYIELTSDCTNFNIHNHIAIYAHIHMYMILCIGKLAVSFAHKTLLYCVNSHLFFVFRCVTYPLWK